MTTAAPSRPATELELDRGFVVASGIECSAPLVGGGHRQDELVKTGHWSRYRDDLALVASFGIRYLRYGVPFHVVARDPAALDWRWTDAALAAVRDAGIEPIVDLMHFGLPDDLVGVSDPRLPDRYVAYARAFAERHPWVRYYTPVNEPWITADLSTRMGWWNERATDPRSHVAAIDNVAACAVLGMAAIRERRPDAIFVQSDACESHLPADAAALDAAAFLDARRFLCWDLTYGRRPDERLRPWLSANGLDEARLAWFEEHGSSEGCIVGLDYYAGNEWLVEADGRQRRAPRRRGFAAVAREHFGHFGLPFMLAETNWEGAAAPEWLALTWNDALQMRLEGLPVRGYTWYGFVDHVDWDSALRDVAGRPNACGLVDLERRPHPVGRRYRALARAALLGNFAALPVAGRALTGLEEELLPPFVDDLGGRTVVGGEAVP